MVRAYGAGRRFGQAVGNLQVGEILRLLRPVVSRYGFTLATNIRLPSTLEKRIPVDVLIRDAYRNPIVVIESKLVQKAKHATEKAAKIVAEHPAIRQANPSVRACLAVLSGDFTDTPRSMIEAVGTKVFFTSRDQVQSVFGRYGIETQWANAQADMIAPLSFARLQALSQRRRQALARDLLSGIGHELKSAVRSALKPPKRELIAQVTVTVTLESGRTVFKRFGSIDDAEAFLKDVKEESIS